MSAVEKSGSLGALLAYAGLTEGVRADIKFIGGDTMSGDYLGTDEVGVLAILRIRDDATDSVILVPWHAVQTILPLWGDSDEEDVRAGDPRSR